jgi:hypothetical protein
MKRSARKTETADHDPLADRKRLVKAEMTGGDNLLGRAAIRSGNRTQEEKAVADAAAGLSATPGSPRYARAYLA